MKLRDKIVKRMVELAGDEASAWTAIESRYGATLRRTWTCQTGRSVRELKVWSEPTYQAHVFLTLVAGKFILGTAPAPWVGRRDQEIPLWLVEAILDEPELALDSHRQLDLRHARRGGRSGDGVKR